MKPTNPSAAERDSGSGMNPVGMIAKEWHFRAHRINRWQVSHSSVNTVWSTGTARAWH